DISDALNFGDKENVLAVRVDNRTDYKEKSSGVGFEWSSKDFNPNYGGINRRVWLHVAGKIYQTLPLFYGLQTTGVYVYPSNISVADKTADVNVEAQVQNGSGDQASITLSTVVVDADGQVHATFDGETIDMVAGEKTVHKATGKLSGAKLWSIESPYLYDVYTILKVNDKVVDVNKVRTGFRKTDFRGGAGTGGVYINDKFVWLTGYAQRATDEWAGLGQAYPAWMHDLTAQLLRASNGNYMRWMHISPQPVDVEAYDRAGIVEVCPAGDKEKDATGRQWEQRMEVMRASMIYMRNHPSILFWEAGNNGISADHMKQMVDLQQELDPSGGRVIGCRTLNDPNTTPIAGYFGVMIGQDPRTDALKSTTQMFRAYSAERRDRAPIIETEDFRDEAARRFWDDYSPPHFGFKPGPNDTYKWNSETFCLAAANRYWAYWSNRISNKDPAHAKWSGYASIYFTDSNADGRQDSSEVARVSGKVDAVRLPKEAFYTYRVMQSEKPDIHIIGHWT
ncbi:MAG TPA: glycoside hydrolase family 2 TIM barrel-domain containing protein, partial [Tepidisphaeraceae bacterium]|nr:glycoside hydrolase family 2 TIM barrel-domain containing protein [Tepidisphaeraceae bacterium]